MRLTLPAAAALLTALSVQAATAETTVIRRDGPDTVVVDRPEVERKTVVTRDSGDGCSSKTVTKTNEYGDRKTVHKETCD
ncbi:hypothetical protein [Methylobacterium symbioticum]|uniref:Secreted protein n=1 Tax=Methylobacterium symbioticum TaxID=2584084 RepID=A0A509EJJ7_9HYPH|nr:hypothetical protein [Methylobacterium symbioticum]VUD73555.1 hypothetical protein MET9862_04174 [Methylobacterium symbioticum]